MDDLTIIETIDTKHEAFQKNCEDKFVTQKSFTLFWRWIIIILIGIVGSCFAWALKTTGSISRLEAETAQYREDLAGVRKGNDILITKMDLVIKAVSTDKTQINRAETK